jgi:hypothetical protein
VEEVRVEPTAEFAQLQLSFVDQTQWRYEVIRPLVLFDDHTAQQRAHETETHPNTVRTLRRRFHRQGMPGLLPADVEVVPRRRAMRPKFSTYKIRIWAMMLKNFHISRPNGR